MPKLQPIAIKTKNKFFIVRIWRWITSVRKWRVLEDYECNLPDGPKVIIPKEFVFDGASIPRPLWGILSPTGLLLIPGLIHDYAYRYRYLWAVDTDNNVYKYKVSKGRWSWDYIFGRVGLDVNGVYFVDIMAWMALFLLGWWAWWRNGKRKDKELFPENYDHQNGSEEI